MSIKSLSFIISLIIITSVAGTNGVQAGGYVITDLGSVVESGSKYAFSESINNTRQVAGYVRWEGGSVALEISPFFYDGAQLHDLSTQIGADSFAYGLNDFGYITGSNGSAYIFDFYGDNLQNLGTLGGDSSTGYAINNAGEVAGASDFSTTSPDEHAFYYDGVTMHDLGTLGGDESRALGINTFGDIVGRSLLAGFVDVRRAFMYSNNQMIDLGTLGGGDRDESYASDINDFGQVTGSSDTGDGSSHAFLYENGVMHDLGTLGGDTAWGSSINNDGHVVGGSRPYHGDATAFLYDGNEMLNLCDLTDCSALGWTWLQSAEAINEAGCIAGKGLIGGESHAFLISWTDEPIAELCTDGIDNDNDGLVDCNDVDDCSQRISCYVPEGMSYDLVDLGTVRGDYSHGTSINNTAQVSGDTSVSRNTDEIHAFFYNGTGMLDLGKLATSDTYSVARGINDDGQITGYSVAPGAPMDNEFNKLFLYANGDLINLHPLFGDACDESTGQAINASGHITGTCTLHVYDMFANEISYAFVYDGNNMVMLTSAGNESYGRGINNNGQVTGSYESPSGYSHAFIYDGAMHDLGTLGGTYSTGNDINDLAQVTGSSSTADYRTHAFFYDGNTMHDLGTYEGRHSTGAAINNSGQIVGNSDRANGERTAFLYHNGRMLSVCALTDCKAKGWSGLIYASDINDRGDITGLGRINGEIHAFLAIATSTPPPAEICNDGIDNDGDGLIDCADPDCNSDLACAVDTDGDGIIDRADNCTLIANPDQTDTNNDGYGNVCDADLSGDEVVDTTDIGIFLNHFSTQNLESDFNADGQVDTKDIGLFINLFSLGQPPGPSGLVP